MQPRTRIEYLNYKINITHFEQALARLYFSDNKYIRHSLFLSEYSSKCAETYGHVEKS